MKKRIFVVDDDPDILDALQFMLEDAGYDVSSSQFGEDAENLANQVSELPDLVILDVLLSGKDGRTIVKILKNTDTTKDIPIIMISAHPSAQQSVFSYGADDFIAKPFDVDIFLDRVRIHLEQAYD